MTLRTGSLRIDAVAVALRRATIVALEERVELRELAEPRVGVVALRLALGPVPALLEDDDGGGRVGRQPGQELGAQLLDPRVLHVVEEVKVVEEPRGLAQPQAQQ